MYNIHLYYRKKLLNNFTIKGRVMKNFMKRITKINKNENNFVIEYNILKILVTCLGPAS